MELAEFIFHEYVLNIDSFDNFRTKAFYTLQDDYGFSFCQVFS